MDGLLYAYGGLLGPLLGNQVKGTLNIEYNNSIVFYGKNNNTSPQAIIGYLKELYTDLPVHAKNTY